MKKSKPGLVLSLVLLGLTGASSASAAQTTDDLRRFDVNCTFGSVGATADARVFLKREAVESVTPEWFTNLLAVSFRGQLISASLSNVSRRNDEFGVRWQLLNADNTVALELKDHPFDGNPNPKTVNAELVIRHERSSGTCSVSEHRVED